MSNESPGPSVVLGVGWRKVARRRRPEEHATRHDELQGPQASAMHDSRLVWRAAVGAFNSHEPAEPEVRFEAAEGHVVTGRRAASDGS